VLRLEVAAESLTCGDSSDCKQTGLGRRHLCCRFRRSVFV